MADQQPPARLDQVVQRMPDQIGPPSRGDQIEQRGETVTVEFTGADEFAEGDWTYEFTVTGAY